MSEQATWVQAVGSVPALISFGRRRAKSAENSERDKTSILSIYPSLINIKRSLQRLIEISESAYSEGAGYINVDPSDGKFQKHIPYLQAVIPRFNELSTFVAVPLRVLTYRLIDMQYWLDSMSAVERSGSPFSTGPSCQISVIEL